MWDRVENGRQDSDTALFSNLMYLGEMTAKLIVAGFVAAIPDDPDRVRYQKVHGLVRADGVGEWAAVLDEVLVGPPSQLILSEARKEQRELTQKVGSDAWQYQAVSLLLQCLRILDQNLETLPAKTDGRRWLSLLAHLRNKTRGHGAPKENDLSRVCPLLERSLRLLTSEFSLFSREWAYIHRNLSGKYRVSKLSDDAPSFEVLKRTSEERLLDGVYVHLDVFARVELAESTVDADDFYLANGGFNEKRFQLLSYSSGEAVERPSERYLAPPGRLPTSETQGRGSLEVQGKCLGNLPPSQTGYIRRSELEKRILSVVCDDHHPIITLVGRGGIGKTWLALAVLHDLTTENRFDSIVWFSARDIDLLQEGSKPVRPHVLDERGIAEEFARLVGGEDTQRPAFKSVEYLMRQLGSAREQLGTSYSCSTTSKP
jgi:hypothetical protein